MIWMKARQDLQDFLGMAQEIESLEGEEQEEKIEEIFGSQEKQKGEQREDKGKHQRKEKKDQRETQDKHQGKKEKKGQREEQEDGQRHRRPIRQEVIQARQGSRANTDVILAMQISDQVAADAAAQKPCYVVHGAKALCSMGSREARRVVPMDHGLMLRKKPQLAVDDSGALTNIMCFGNCFSTENPEMEQAAIDATNRYNEEKSQNLWGWIKSIFGVKPKTVDSASKELQELCICKCEPCFSEGAVWEEGNEKSIVTGRKTLIQSDTIVCKYGGIIRIIDNGQNGQLDQEM